jgi:hypothetical protein
MSSLTSSSEAPRIFPHTRWSLVLAATQKEAPESAAALEAICCAIGIRFTPTSGVAASHRTTHKTSRRSSSAACLKNAGSIPPTGEKGKLRMFLIGAETFHEQ